MVNRRSKNHFAKQKANVLFSARVGNHSADVSVATFMRLIEINRTNWRECEQFARLQQISIWILKSAPFGGYVLCLNAYISFDKINTDKLQI